MRKQYDEDCRTREAGYELKPMVKKPPVCVQTLCTATEAFSTCCFCCHFKDICGDDGIRTHDLYVANVPLSQLSYIPFVRFCCFAYLHHPFQ